MLLLVFPRDVAAVVICVNVAGVIVVDIVVVVCSCYCCFLLL